MLAFLVKLSDQMENGSGNMPLHVQGGSTMQ